MQRRKLSSMIALVAMAAAGLAASPAVAERPAAPTYDRLVLADDPVGYWPQNASGGWRSREVTRQSPDAVIHGSPTVGRMPNGDKVLVFDGQDDYLEIADSPTLSPATTGQFTVEAWMRPDVLVFESSERAGYVHWMGKGEPGQHEWVSRIYSLDNTAGRENRISGYLFNLDGGLGAGSYYQEPIEPGQWLHYALVINAEYSSDAYPEGYTKLYVDGVLVDVDSLVFDGTQMVPGDGTAPVRVGTRDFGSFFEGAIGKVAIYDYELAPERIAARVEVMRGQ